MTPIIKAHLRQLDSVLSAVVMYRWWLICPASLVMVVALASGLTSRRQQTVNAFLDRYTDPVVTRLIDHHLNSTSDTTQHNQDVLCEDLTSVAAIDQAISRLRQTVAQNPDSNRLQADLNALQSDMVATLGTEIVLATKTLQRVRVSFVTQQPEAGRQAIDFLIRDYAEHPPRRVDPRLEAAVEAARRQYQHHVQRIEKLDAMRLAIEIEYPQLLRHDQDALASHLKMTSRIAQLRAQRDTLLARNTPPQHTPGPFWPAQEPVALPLDRDEQPGDPAHRIAVTPPPTEASPDPHATARWFGSPGQTLQKPHRVDVARLLSAGRPEPPVQNILAMAELRRVENTLRAVQMQSEQRPHVLRARRLYRSVIRRIQGAESHSAMYQDYLRKLQMALLPSDGEVASHFEVFRPYVATVDPAGDRVLRLTTKVIGALIGAGLVVAYWAHRIRSPFTDGTEVAQACRLPLIGSVSQIVSGQQERRDRRRTMVLYPIKALVMTLFVSGILTLVWGNMQRVLTDMETLSTQEPEKPRIQIDTIGPPLSPAI